MLLLLRLRLCVLLRLHLCLRLRVWLRRRMAHRGDLAALDRQIETLMAREKLSEAEVKALCEKARRRP